MSTGSRAGSRSRTGTITPGKCLFEGHILDHIVNGRIYGEIRPHLSPTKVARSRSASVTQIRRCNKFRSVIRKSGS